ncbi:uncharacterized protein LOC110196004 [Phascolarctos cinereus]|uniref:Uncharacterized protein LOC110196004 n=1 Tax=Phascolarctos cinereus TaxID=38626 RepID=A0A6P5IRG4_PHACI|nr:uncharacterized protein LOC110196004 [Phascolarctos cinereus]
MPSRWAELRGYFGCPQATWRPAPRRDPPPPVWRPGSPPRAPPRPGLFLPTPNRAPAASVTWAWEYGAGEGPGGRASAGCALPRSAVRPSRWSESLAAAPREPGRAAGEGPAGQRSRQRESPEERRLRGPAAEPSSPHPVLGPPRAAADTREAQPGPPPTRDARSPLARARLGRASEEPTGERARQPTGRGLPLHAAGSLPPRETRSRRVSPRARVTPGAAAGGCGTPPPMRLEPLGAEPQGDGVRGAPHARSCRCACCGAPHPGHARTAPTVVTDGDPGVRSGLMLPGL